MCVKVIGNLPSFLLLVLPIISRSEETQILMLHWIIFQIQNIIKDLSHAVEFITVNPLVDPGGKGADDGISSPKRTRIQSGKAQVQEVRGHVAGIPIPSRISPHEVLKL